MSALELHHFYPGNEATDFSEMFHRPFNAVKWTNNSVEARSYTIDPVQDLKSLLTNDCQLYIIHQVENSTAKEYAEVNE